MSEKKLEIMGDLQAKIEHSNVSEAFKKILEGFSSNIDFKKEHKVGIKNTAKDGVF